MYSIIIFVSLLIYCCLAEIYDPANIFCGPANCYDILELERTATPRDIKKVNSSNELPNKTNFYYQLITIALFRSGLPQTFAYPPSR